MFANFLVFLALWMHVAVWQISSLLHLRIGGARPNRTVTNTPNDTTIVQMCIHDGARTKWNIERREKQHTRKKNRQTLSIFLLIMGLAYKLYDSMVVGDDDDGGDRRQTAERQPNNEWRWWRWWLFLLLFFFFRFSFVRFYTRAIAVSTTTTTARRANDEQYIFSLLLPFLISRKVEIIINTKITNAKEKVLKLFVSILRASNFRFSNSLLMLFVAATVDQTTHTHAHSHTCTHGLRCHRMGRRKIRAALTTIIQ